MLASQLPVRRTTPTLGEYLGRWLEITRRRLRPSTIENYELNVARITAYLGDLPLTRLNPPKIQDVYDRLSDSGLSKHSVLQVHRTLHRSLQRAFNWGLIPRNPATATMPPRPEKRQTTALELAELQGCSWRPAATGCSHSGSCWEPRACASARHVVVRQ